MVGGGGEDGGDLVADLGSECDDVIGHFDGLIRAGRLALVLFLPHVLIHM